MTPIELAQSVLASTQADEARVVAGHVRAGLTRFAESHIHQHVGEDATSLELTVVRDGRVASASTTDTTAEGLARLVARAQDLSSAAPVDHDWPGMAGAGQVQDPDNAAASTIEATGEDRARVVRDFVVTGGANAAGYCDTEVATIAVADSAGAAHQQTRTRATLDGIHRFDGGISGSGHQTSTALADLDGQIAGTQARRLADLGTVPAEFEPGRFEVVLAPECVATIAVFLSVYGFNAKSHHEGASGIELGAGQFDPSLTLRDDPLGREAISLGYDLEGTPKSVLELIRDGVSTSLAHDRRSAAKAGTHSTGHGGPGSTSWGPVADNLVVSAASGATTTPVAELAATMGSGLLITAFNYCRILEPKSISVTGLTRNGTFLVSDGRIVGSIGNVRFTQSFRDALGPDTVLGIGDDSRFADAEFGPAMAHVPSLRLRSWNITGDVRG